MSLKHRAFRIAFYWLPPVLWMSTIFALSSRQSIGVTHTYLYDFLIFKTLHILEYAGLFFLFFRAFHSTRLSITRQHLFSVVAAVAFAATDEIHQLFVATRTGRIRDILIDTAGILIMYMLVRKYHKFFKRVHAL